MVVQIRDPFGVLLIKVPYYIGDLKGGPQFGEPPHRNAKASFGLLGLRV